jgi:hypothetical protein
MKHIENKFHIPITSLTSYFPKDIWPFIASLKYLQNSQSQTFSAIIFGSQKPFIEGWLIYMGITNIVVSEYNELTYNHSSIQTISAGKKALESYQHSFDLAFSISSFDHGKIFNNILNMSSNR